MSDKRFPADVVTSKHGYQPGSNGQKGYQPTPKSPGAGHQPGGAGAPQPPTTGSGVKPAAPKK